MNKDEHPTLKSRVSLDEYNKNVDKCREKFHPSVMTVRIQALDAENFAEFMESKREYLADMVQHSLTATIAKGLVDQHLNSKYDRAMEIIE